MAKENKEVTEVKEVKEVKKPEAAKFTKEQITASATFARYRDFLNGNLDSTKVYTKSQIEEVINKTFRKVGR